MNNLSFIPTTCIRLFFGLILANSFMLHEVYAQFLDPNIQIQQQIRQENEDLQRRRQADEINRAHQKSQHLSGSAKEKSDLNADTQRAQFNSYGLYGLINNNFLLPKTQINLNHNLTFDSQISKNRLFNSEQMAIGGRYTVRGFAESSISGDSGYYIKNDLGANVFQLMPNVIKNSFATSLLQKLSAGVFYDYGYVRNKIVNDKTDEGYMSGGGARLNYNGEYFKVDLTYSKGLHSPQFLRNINHILEDNESIYLDIKFGLL
jgi:hypothetical protein